MKTAFRPSEESLLSAVESLCAGQTIVMPTDTVYGLACQFDRPDQIQRIQSLKGRSGKSGTVICTSIDQLNDYGIDTSEIADVSDQFWPGPVSISLPLPSGLAFINPEIGRNAFRVPGLDWLRAVLGETGPLMTSSANLTGQPSCTSVDQARQTFGDKIPLYVDGGDLGGRQSSRIIQIDANGNAYDLR